MSFEFEIDPKDEASAEFMTRVHKVLLREVMKAAKEHKITRAEISRILDVDKSVVTRALSGTSNLTIRTISDLFWAIGVTPEFDAYRTSEEVGCNFPVKTKPVQIDDAMFKNLGRVKDAVSWAEAGKREYPNSSPQAIKNMTRVSYAS